MKTLLFFDGWFLDSHVDIERFWARAEPVELPQGPTMGRAGIVLDAARGRFLAWARIYDAAEASLHASADGSGPAPREGPVHCGQHRQAD